MNTLSVNDVTAVRVRLFVPWVGAWIADVDLDIGSDKPMPTGKAVLTINDAKLIGTIDPRASGRYGEKGSVRVVAGAGGWNRDIGERDFHNDGGLKRKDIAIANGGAAGETTIDTDPFELTSDYIRIRGAASLVLKDRYWYVDDKGITQVAKRPTAKMPADYDLLTWDPYLRLAELAGESILWPGTMLEDSRIGDAPHRAIVRDVEHVFDGTGARVKALCAMGETPTTDSTRFSGAFARAVRMFAGIDHLKSYRYRIVKQNVDGRLFLQAIRKTSGVPDTLPISIFPGMAGDSAEHVAGTVCNVIFTEADPSQPMIIGFDGTPPKRRRIKAKDRIDIGDDSDKAAARIGDTVNAGYLVLTSTGTVVSYFPGDVPPSNANFQSATTAANNISGSVISMTGGVIVSGSAKTRIE